MKPKAIDLWESGGYEPDGCAIPIGRRELIDITDIRLIDEGELENSQKTVAVTFTWKLQTNKVGKAFDPQSSEFKALGQQLQVLLFDTGTAAGMTKPYRHIQTGTAYFEDGEFGWQIVRIEAEAG